MVVWRISKKIYALDRIGVGAMKTGGRWNSIDIPIIYTGMFHVGEIHIWLKAQLYTSCCPVPLMPLSTPTPTPTPM